MKPLQNTLRPAAWCFVGFGAKIRRSYREGVVPLEVLSVRSLALRFRVVGLCPKPRHQNQKHDVIHHGRVRLVLKAFCRKPKTRVVATSTTGSMQSLDTRPSQRKSQKKRPQYNQSTGLQVHFPHCEDRDYTSCVFGKDPLSFQSSHQHC